MRWPWQWGESDEDKAARLQREQEQQAGAQALRQGRILPKAALRLQELAESGEFTSGLSIKDMLVLREAGFKPIGQVMGSTFFHFGQIMVPVRQSARLTVVEKAQYDARQLALGRMQQEAAALGACGVVGVSFKLHNREWSEGVTEFAALGTAVRAPEPSPDGPWLSTLSGQDLWTLRQAGYRPCGLALGVAAEYVFPDPDTRSLLQGFLGSLRNGEVTQYGLAFQEARRRAEHAMHQDAVTCRADGILGVTIVPTVTRLHVQGEEGYPTILVKFVAMGTCVVAAGQPSHGPPLLIRHLADGAVTRLDLDEAAD